MAQNRCYRFGAVIETKMTTDSKCVHSPSGHHQFKDIDAFNRDDSGFYLNCMHCNQTVMFDVDTEEDFYDLFGFDTDDDY